MRKLLASLTGWGCVADHIGLYGVFNTADPVDAPEPASIALFAAGFTGLRRMRKRALPRS